MILDYKLILSFKTKTFFTKARSLRIIRFASNII